MRRSKTASLSTPTPGAALYGTTSDPFPKPETGRIAVKVINDYGDEMMKVFDVWLGSESVG